MSDNAPTLPTFGQALRAAQRAEKEAHAAYWRSPPGSPERDRLAEAFIEAGKRLQAARAAWEVARDAGWLAHR